jgi:N-acetylneuraminate synthase/sialic acid synthase
VGGLLQIGADIIGDATDCYVIAEIGHNHQGKLDTAFDLFRQAKEVGANAVKLQKRDNRTLYTKKMFNRPYENENSFGPIYGEHREALEFDLDEYRELQQYAQEIGITFFATAFDFPSADFLAALDMPAYKIASGDLRNTPLLSRVAQIGKPMVISTGAATLDDVRRAYDTIMPINPQLAILQCTAGYPAVFEELNLEVIRTYLNEFPDAVVGFSGHDNGIAMSLAAYVLGARIVEKHFTLNRAMKGTDHKFSLEPMGMRKLVRDLRRARVALGDGMKRVYESEMGAYEKMGKKLVAARALREGHTLTLQDIAIKSPGDGIPPCELNSVVGKILLRSMEEDDAFSYDMVAAKADAAARNA